MENLSLIERRRRQSIAFASKPDGFDRYISRLLTPEESTSSHRSSDDERQNKVTRRHSPDHSHSRDSGYSGRLHGEMFPEAGSRGHIPASPPYQPLDVQRPSLPPLKTVSHFSLHSIIPWTHSSHKDRYLQAASRALLAVRPSIVLRFNLHLKNRYIRLRRTSRLRSIHRRSSEQNISSSLFLLSLPPTTSLPHLSSQMRLTAGLLECHRAINLSLRGHIDCLFSHTLATHPPCRRGFLHALSSHCSPNHRLAMQAFLKMAATKRRMVPQCPR